MKIAGLVLLAMCAAGCGYSSHGTMAPGAPTIGQLMPSRTAAGGAAFTLTVMGTGMVSGAVVYWDGTTRSTTFVSATEVQAAITAADIGTAATIPVYVRNPGGTGTYGNQMGQSSASVMFTVTP